MALQGDDDQAVRISTRVLVIGARDWFTSALAAVLEPQGFAFYEAPSGEAGLAQSLKVDPEVVLIDVGLPDMGAAELCRQLVRGPLGSEVPILVYSPNVWPEREQAKVLAAGAWETLSEPVGSRLLVDKLRRLLELRSQVRGPELEIPAPDREFGLFSLAGLERTLPLIDGIAGRHRLALSCAVLGPTQPGSARELIENRQRTARHCLAHTRSSDLCALVGGGDVVVIACGAEVRGATGMARRLIELAAQGVEAPATLELSAGIVEFSLPEPPATPDRAGEPRRTRAARVAPHLEAIESARGALDRARAAGGGIQVFSTG